jgi:hypothetical protein
MGRNRQHRAGDLLPRTGLGISEFHRRNEARAGELAGQFQYVRPRRSPRWPWFVVGGVTVLPLIFLFVTASVNESAKINKMVSIADGIPAADWKVITARDPRRDIGCIPFDQPCYSLFRDWESPEPVDLDELVASTGHDLEPSYEGCVVGQVDGYKDGWQDRVHFQLCVDGNKVDLAMSAR